MIRNVKYLTILLCVVLLSSLINPSSFAISDPEPIAQAVVVADLDSGNILYEKNMTSVRSPASLTKIITGLLAVEAIEKGVISEEDIITAPDDCLSGLDNESSTADPAIQPGEQLKFIDVLYCALLHSSNEACNIIAVAVEGSIANFVDSMNMRCRELGTADTRFFDTNGLLSDNATTAYDLYLITKEAMKHPLFATIVNTESYTVPATNMTGEVRELHNSNALLTSSSVYGAQYRYEGVSGVKTGYTNAAGYCLVSTCQRNGMNILCIVLGCNGWLNAKEETYGNFSESIKLYDWVFNNFSQKTVLLKDDIAAQAQISNADGDDTVYLVPSRTVKYLLPNDLTDFDISTSVSLNDDKLIAPISAGDELGNITIFINGENFGSVPLISTNSIAAKHSIIPVLKIGNLFKSGLFKTIVAVTVVAVILFFVIRAWFKSIQKKHLIARAIAEEKRNKARKDRETEIERSRLQAADWRTNIVQDEETLMKESVKPTKPKEVETDLDALIKSLGLPDYNNILQNREDNQK